MAWWILGGVVMLAALGFVVQWRRQNEMARRLETQMADAREQAVQAVSESRAQVKRIERERSREVERAEHRLLKDLLPLMDALDAASASATDESAGPVREGLRLVRRQLEDLLEKHEIRRIEPDPGQAFDPQIHEAVEVRPTAELEPGAVATCHRAGYAQREDLLRAAMVAVAGEAENEEAAGHDPGEGGPDEAELDLDEAANHELTDPAIESNLAPSQPFEQK